MSSWPASCTYSSISQMPGNQEDRNSIGGGLTKTAIMTRASHLLIFKRCPPTPNTHTGYSNCLSIPKTGKTWATWYPKLERLGLRGTHFLDANLLGWKPTSGGLKYIYLSRTKIGADNLIQLFSPSNHIQMDSSLLSKIWFAEVDLTTEEWSTVF